MTKQMGNGRRSSGLQTNVGACQFNGYFSTMSHQRQLKVLAVAGSLQRASVTRVVLHELVELLKKAGCATDLVDLGIEPLPLYNPDISRKGEVYLRLKPRVEAADVFILGTPDYHGSVSGATKNFLDHFWHEFTGKLFGTVVASHEKGLTATDQLRTMARQCYAWTLPYGVSLAEKVDVKDGHVTSDTLRQKLEMMARDLRVYGNLLAAQRKADLAGLDPGFMAKQRH
jgi:FMN reductase